jgi:uncharacterized membrane protein YdbT with pleckstrin-like domain
VAILGAVLAAVFVFPLAFFLILIPAGFALWKWLVVHSQQIVLTTERIRTSDGVFSKRREELELYRVKDMALTQPFLMRMVSLGNLVLMTSDRTDPEFVIHAVTNPQALLDQIRKYVEARRDQKRVREVDFDQVEATPDS